MATLETGPNGQFPSARAPEDRLPGGKAVTRLISGLDGVVQSNTAATQEVRRMVDEVRIATEATARMATSINTLASQQAAILRTLGTQAVSAGAPAVLSRQSPGAGVAAPVTAAHERAVAPSQWLPDGSMMGEQVTAATPNITRDEPGPSGYDRIQSARGYSVARLRHDTGRWLGRAISQIPAPALRQNPLGTWMTVDKETGDFLDYATESQIRRMNIANRVRGVGGMVAEQGMAKGLLNALPKGAIGAAAGGLGALAILQQGLDFAEQQREENRRYQAVSGGDNLSGFGERLNQNLFAYSLMGQMDGAQAQRLYEGVFDTGVTGRRRQEMLDFGTRNYRQLGMSPEETLRILNASLAAGIESLNGLAESLDTVTASAREAGVNAQEARALFTQTYTSAAPNMTTTGGATVAASGLVSAFTGLGHAYSNVNLSGVFTPDNMRLMGAMQGMTQTQFLAETSGPQGGQQFARMYQAQVIDLARRLLPQAEQAIVEFKRARNITGALTSDQAEALALELYRQYPHMTSPGAIQSVLANPPFSIQLPLNQVVPFLLLALDMSWNPEGNVSAEVAASQRSSLSAAGRTNFGSDNVDGVSTMGEVLEAIGADPMLDTFTDQSYFDAEGNFVEGETRLTMDTSGGSGRQAVTGARGLYATAINEGRADFSPIIAGMLRQGDHEQRFRINVGTETRPEWREMNMYDAMRYYQDQLERGDVMITQGTGEGQMLYEALGMTAPDSSVNVRYDPNNEGAKRGEAWEEENARGSGQAVGAIEVYASPELQSLLRFRPVGSATIVDAPPSAITSPGSLPSGNYTYGGG